MENQAQQYRAGLMLRWKRNELIDQEKQRQGDGVWGMRRTRRRAAWK